jgi:putative NADH-flavin reductase
MSRVLIIGASRGIGREAVKQALESGHAVRAFARTADQITIDHPSLEKRNGNALRPEDLSSALDDVDAVIQALGIRAGPEMIIGPVTLFSAATRALIPAMEKADVIRLIAVTGFGAGDSRHRISCLQRIPFRLLLGRAYDDKSVQENLIRRSGLEWVIARPVVLTNGAKTGKYRILLEPDQWRNGLISRADVADFLIKQIENGALTGKTPVIAY